MWVQVFLGYYSKASPLRVLSLWIVSFWDRLSICSRRGLVLAVLFLGDLLNVGLEDVWSHSWCCHFFIAAVVWLAALSDPLFRHSWTKWSFLCVCLYYSDSIPLLIVLIIIILIIRIIGLFIFISYFWIVVLKIIIGINEP